EGRRRVRVRERRAELDAVHAGHAHVEERRLELERLVLTQGQERRGEHRHLEALQPEQLGEVRGELDVVVEDEHSARHSGALVASKTRITKRAPPEGGCSTSRVPWCRSTMRLQSARPSPLPVLRVVTSGSKRLCRTS